MNWTKKEWGLLIATIMVLLVIVNLVAYFVIIRKIGVSIYDSVAYKKEKLLFKKEIDKGSIPHPFFGLSTEGGEKLISPLTSEPLFDRISPTNSKEPIKVLVLGGSVASHLSNHGMGQEEYLFSKLLNKHFSTDRFVVYNAAFSGGKQPQQYFKYLYLDLIGFHPDIVINLDGFNEIALPLAENKPLGNPAIFPRSYSRLLHASTSDRSCAILNNQLLDMDTKIPIIELINWIYVGDCTKKIESSPSDIPWWSRGMGVTAEEDYISRSVAIWEESSNKLYKALSTSGVDYIHILQPNQYVEGSKKFSNEELNNYLGNQSYGISIKQYYSLLSSKNLIEKNFRDQRYIFKDVSETVYADQCCHLNRLGMELIIKDLISSNDAVFRKHLQ